MSGNSPIHPFRVYILRCWAEQMESSSFIAWRFSLEPINARERRGFIDLDSLASFIRGEIQAAEAIMKEKGRQKNQAEMKESPRA